MDDCSLSDTFIQNQRPLEVLMNTPLNGEKRLRPKLLTAPINSDMVSLPFNAESDGLKPARS